MKKRLMVTVGNVLMGDDAAGSLLGRKMQQAPIDGWTVVDGGSAPENYLHLIREISPDQVVIIDAADMDLSPGDIRLIETDQIADPFLMTTHTLPLSYFMQSLREFVPQVDLIGIQPRTVAFGYPVSIEIREAVDQIYDSLQRDAIVWEQLSSASRPA